MIWPYKLIGGLVLAAALFASGWYSRTPETKIETVVKTEVKEVVVEKVVTKIQKQKVTTPDGTVTENETVVIVDDSSQTITKVKKKEKSVSETLVQVRRDYSLGVSWQPDWRNPTWQPSGAVVGRRVISDLWANVGYDWRAKSLTVGVAWQF